MKRVWLLTISLALTGCGLAGCSADDNTRGTLTATSSQGGRPTASPAAPSSTPAGGQPATTQEPPVLAAHGKSGGAGPAAPPAAGASGQSAQTEIDTSELDAKVERADAEARKKGATDADRRAAASAYFERGYRFYKAQNPRLYKFALGDFRHVLRYQPDNQEARAIIEQIEAIYRSMGRPIPTNGLEP